FLVMASLYSFSRGRDWLAGLLLALAIASKVTPALFVVYFLWKRCWGVLIGCGVGLALFFFVVPSLVFAVQKGSLVDGWSQNWSALTAWVDGMIVPYVVRGEVWSERENQSLPGLLSRLLAHEPSFSKWINDAETPLAYHNFADLTPMAIKRIVQLCQLAFLLLMVFVCWAPVRARGTSPKELRRGWRLAAEYSLILVGMLLFSERTWKHHCVTLILPFAVLGYVAFAAGFPRWKRRVATIALFTAACLILLPAAAELAGKGSLTDAVGELRPDARQQLGVSPNSARELAQVYGAYTVAFVVLLVGIATSLVGRKKETASGAA